MSSTSRLQVRDIAPGNLMPEPLDAVPQFNWLFLVELIVCGILVLFFLFYFNRLFATLLSYGIRAYTWHYYRVYVDIHSLQLSLLGGRIFFKGFRYHGENETILVHSGYLTWRYWLRSVKAAGLFRDDEDTLRTPGQKPVQTQGSGNGGADGHFDKKNRLPCRIELTLQGLEWFVYNRSAAYESILAGFPGSDQDHNHHTPREADDDATNNGKDPSADTSVRNTQSPESLPCEPYPSRRKQSSATEYGAKVLSRVFTSHDNLSSGAVYSNVDSNETALPKFLTLLPVSVQCTKGAFVIGNENTNSIMTATYEKATGEIDVKKAGPLDHYKQVFDFDFSHPVIQMKPNPDFRHSQLAAAGAAAPGSETPKQYRKRDLHWRYQRHKRRLWHSVRDLIPYFQRSVESFHPNLGDANAPKPTSRATSGLPSEARWIGLTRYLDEEDQDEHEGWNAVEYGRFSTILDSPRLLATYHWDTPGTVMTDEDRQAASGHEDINGSKPPDWALHLVIQGGMINYGPWADRERACFQKILFPNPYRNAEPAVPLGSGRPRQSTKFSFTIDIQDDITVRIPTREPSKDWSWKGRADAVKGSAKLKKRRDKEHPRDADPDKSSHGPDIRPFGWFSLQIDGNSTIEYEMGMVASGSGYQNRLDIHLNGSRMTSSINHGLMWQSGKQTITCDMSNPLEWNSLRTWNFTIKSQGLDLFLLRDHVYLLTDMVSDWTSGSSPDFHAFVPFQYNISFVFDDFKLFINLNDSNIINNPADTDDNAFLVIKCDSLQSNIGIPIVNYRPSRNTVSFDISGTGGLLQLITPLWNTQRTFMKDPSVGSLKKLKLVGSYTYNIGTSPSLTDILTVDIDGDCPQLYLYGFLIRYLLNIKINYFGENQHFKTLDEFQEILNTTEPSSRSNDTNPVPKTNDLDVTFHIRGQKPNLLLPANIYGSGDNVTINAAFLEADVRFTNYYMDLEVFFSPLEAALESLQSTDSRTTSTPQLFVDGLRIYGHRVFGLPPAEPTYVCNWDFEVGKLIGECTPAFLRCGKAALRNVGFSIDDEENALPPLRPTTLHDVTFLRATVQSIDVWTLVDGAAVLASTGALKLDFNDLAGSKFSNYLNLNIPSLILAVVDKNSARQQEELSKPTKALAYFETAINVKKVGRKYDFVAARDLQQQHIRDHDQRSNRTPWLLRRQDHSSATPGEHHSKAKLNPPTMPLPPMPEPVRDIPVHYRYSSRSSSSWPDNRTTPRYGQSLGDGEGCEKGTETLVSEKSDRNFKSTTKSEQPSGLNKPPFRLYGTLLDTHLVPQLPSLGNFSTRTGDGADELEFSSGLDSDKEAQAYVLCELYKGLKGYCSPEAISILPSLLDGLQPSHPTEIIDSLQDDVVTDILRHGKRLSKPKQTLTASLRIPVCRVKLIGHSTSPDIQYRDEYYLELCRIRALYRKRAETLEHRVEPIELAAAIHTSIDSLSISAGGEEIDAFGQKSVLHGKLEDIVLWSASQGPKRSRIQVQNAEATTSNDSVVGLALLFERTSRLIDSITASFKQTTTTRSRRLHSLIYSLTKSGSQTSDPLFLTRPSYVLRAAGEHLRLHDSWKIVSRFRNIYNSLPQGQKAELTLGCIENTISSPPDARTFVLSNFDGWRTWDIAHVRKSYVMKVIWNDLETSHSQKFDSDAGSISVSLRTLRLSVDSAPKENCLLVEDLWVCIDRNSKLSHYEHSTASRRPSVDIRSYCSNSFLCLKWEICQLVEDVFKKVSKKPRQSVVYPRNSNSSSSSSDKVSQSKNQDFHLVFASNTGRIELDGINLKVDLAGDGFKGSIIQQSPGVGAPDKFSIVVASDSSSMALTSRSNQLMSWQLLRPNIYLSRTSERKGLMTEHDWKCAAACRRLNYDMTEDPVGLIHVADLIVQDEIEYILGVTNYSGSPEPQDATSEDREIHHFRIATFLNDYQLRISLLPSVSYLISGEGASLSVSPAPELKVEVDFDIKNNVHALQSDKDGNLRDISSLAGPPINGRILVDPLHGRTSLDIDSTIEVMKVEAGAVRNLLAAINGPEISHFVADLSHDARVLKYRLVRVLSPDPPSPSVKTAGQKRELVYKLRLTLAGIEINSTAPGLRNRNYWADLNFNSGMIQVHLENAPTGGKLLEYPDFQVNIHQVKFGLQKREGVNVQSCGSIALLARISGTSHINDSGEMIRSYRLSSDGLNIELLAETVSMMIDIVAHLQKRLKSIDLSHEIMHLRKIRLIGSPERTRTPQIPVIETPDQLDHKKLFDAMYSVDLSNIQLTWLISGGYNADMDSDAEDLVFSIRRVELATKRDNAARLRIEDMQLQMIRACDDKTKRSQNSALLPEVVFNVAYLSTNAERRFAFQAAGKALDIRITSDFILPASLLQNSLASASEKLREANSLWVSNIASDEKKKETNPNIKRLGSLLIDSDFAGAVVSLQSRHSNLTETGESPGQRRDKANSSGKYGQYVPGEAAATARLEAPGVALKVQFEDTGTQDPTLNAELKIDASTNALHPTVVPLITQISSSVREVVGDDDSENGSDKERGREKALQGKAIGANDPTTILGRCQLNVGLRICRQEFTLSCQPIARVAATACFEDSYITVNTVQSEEKRRFFAVLFAFNSVQASIKHVYSSDSTARCEIDSIVMSLMNSKHVSSSAGISAILKISPTKVYGNVKQAQDFLLFREIWIPQDNPSNPPKAPAAPPETHADMVQRYRQMASAGAFPWDSTFAIEELNVQLDLGQTVGKSDFTIRNLWMSSKKSSDWEQNLCFGFDTISIENKGRLSGFVELSGIKARTSIMWPDEEPAETQTPLIQASIGFAQLQAKVSFEYQPFLVADVTSLEFLMYNVRQTSGDQNDRLVSTLEGDKFQVFCTVLTASQALALYQTLQRLVQEKQAAYDASLKEIEIFLRRKATPVAEGAQPQTPEPTRKDESSDDGRDDDAKMPISLHTDVMVNLRAIKIGAFPSTFYDNQVFKLEALDADVRFTAAAADGRTRGGLALTLGQLRVGLSSIHGPNEPATEDLSVSDVVDRATDSRGGTILNVPRVLASMETWQAPASSQIDYIFKSSFEGRVDVGWNYSRISFIRGMWANHSRALANRLGKPLPKAAVKITGGPKEGEDGEYSGQEKITAVVNVPQSRYIYSALEPPVIETPQLRDMGEATPPLEWIGLHRDKLPNLTHQIIMVTLMEIAKDVEDAYLKILGS